MRDATGPGWSLAPALRPYVSALVAYDSDLGAPGVHIGMPSTSLTFVLALDEPLDVQWAGDPGSRRRRWSTLSGLHSAPAAIHHDGTQRGIQLALTTAGARALFGLPAAGLARELVELADVDRELGLLPEQLADAAPRQRVRVVERALMASLSRHGAAGPRAEVGRALAGLTRGASVAQVAADVGYSRRHLATLVRAECGLSPKEYQRVARFESSHRLLRARAGAGRPSLAGIAAAVGYADQAHLDHEWAALAGCSPTHWLRAEFPFLQDHGDAEESG